MEVVSDFNCIKRDLFGQNTNLHNPSSNGDLLVFSCYYKLEQFDFRSAGSEDSRHAYEGAKSRNNLKTYFQDTANF